MRIIDKYKDYYDHAEVWHDESRKWVRGSALEIEPRHNQAKSTPYSKMKAMLDNVFEQYSIGFYTHYGSREKGTCVGGIIVNDIFYPFIKLAARGTTYNPYQSHDYQFYITKKEDLGKLSDYRKKDALKMFPENLDDYDFIFGKENYNIPINSLLNEPLVLFMNDRFTTNPNLLKEGLTFLEPHFLHDEIERWIFDVQGEKYPEPQPLSEKEKVAQKGFDKWSFRNPDPPKRKQKK